MKKVILIVLGAGLLIWSCSSQPKETADMNNPFFIEYDTEFQVPPFDRIHEEHYLPAFKEGIRREQTEISALIDNPDSPTFDNTLDALENTGDLLTKVSAVFYNLNSSLTDEKMQEIARQVSPLLSKHSDDILLNEKLFARIKSVYEQKEEIDLTPEQSMLLKKYYRDFVRGGANLNAEEKNRLRKINEKLALLTLQFGENVLKEDNAFELVIEDEADLEGLPESVVTGAAEAAAEHEHEGRWIFTLHKPSMIPFLTYSIHRDLREQIFKAYINRGNNDNEQDNKRILAQIAQLRAKKARLLGYKTHAHFVLEKNMAKLPENVYALLDQLWKPALKRAKDEAQGLQEVIDREGCGFSLQPWDWWYYAEKLKQARFDLNDAALRPYFQLENVRKGAFAVAEKLYGIRFIERSDLPKYHEDVDVFEVREADGTHIGVYYTDYYPRASKRGGAWMNALRQQRKKNGRLVTPIICNVGNFSKPTGDLPALISFEEAATLFHEFGHALHGLLSACTYPKLSGTSVPRDFVELPSQIMENWATHSDVLKMYAVHYQTGEPIPQELIDKIKKAGHFNQGFITVEYLAASYLDMDWHTLTDPTEEDPLGFEARVMQRIGLIPEIISRYQSPYFSHIFSGGYSSGYYSYIWAEVLDSDAFEAFKAAGIFNRETARSFRENILAKGGTEEPMTLYKRFRGAEPKVEALLNKRGLN